MTIVGALPNTITNGQAIDAVPVQGNFDWIVSQVNANTPNNDTLGIQTAIPTTCTATGTADALIGIFTPAVLAINGGMRFYVRASAANATTTPTFTPNSGTITAKTIVRPGGVALTVGDISGAGHWLQLEYDLSFDAWVLANPAKFYVSGSDAQGDILYRDANAWNRLAAGNLGQILQTQGGGANPVWVTPVLGSKNRIINGAMMVDQERSGAAVTPSASPTYVLDQYDTQFTQASKLTFQQVADAPAGFKYSEKITVASQFSPGATDFFTFVQRIEQINIIDMQFGLAGAVTLTLSMYIKGSVPGTYSCSLRNNALNRSYVGTITVGTGWTRVQINLVADTAGTWSVADSLCGLYLSVDLGSGSNYNTTAGTWQAGNYNRTAGSVTFVNQVNGSTLNITGVQLEKGVMTEFEHKKYADYLTDCKRYAQWLPINISFYGSNNNAMGFDIPFYEMRTAPTIAALVADPANTQYFTNVNQINWSYSTTNGSRLYLSYTAVGDCSYLGYRALATARM